MCGIAGAFQQPDGERLTRVMSDRLSHRGPDADGLHAHEDSRVAVQLAHRRLSIIDLSAAADQPMTRHGLTLVYNGELYNFRQLRQELAQAGVQFRSRSDTEVILEAWRRWGPEALTRFRGMFALAVFDQGSGCLYVARDQLGIKPLYLMRRGDGVLFASELKGLVSAVGRELSVEPAAVVASMLYYWLPDEYCVLSGVQKLPAGSWAEFRPDGQWSVHPYWRLAEVAAEAAAGPPLDLAAVVEDSVAAHLVSDVPVSSFLSGGLDSSIVTVLAKRLEPGVDAYTMTFRPEDHRLEAMPDDARYARKVAAAYGISLHEIEVSPDVVGLLPRMVDILDEPIGDPAAINTLLMCQAAREAGVKVMLSGMGADELFGGYRKHLACAMSATYQRLPAALRTRVVRPAVDLLPVTVRGRGLRYVRWGKRFLTFAELSEEAAFRRSYTLYDPPELAGLLSPELGGYVDDVVKQHSAVYHDTTLTDHVNRMCLADARMFLPGLNLAYTDRASMAASTEVRVPFVDTEVVRAAFSIPGGDKIRRRRQKLALKQAAEAWLPREVVHRPKASFSVPLRAWVATELREVVDDLLVNGRLVSSGLLQREALASLVADDRAGREDRSKQVWQLLTLELWYRQAASHGVAL